MKIWETTTRLNELAKGFLAKATFPSRKRINSFCSDSPKDWYYVCESTLYKKYKIFDDTKSGNGKHMIG